MRQSLALCALWFVLPSLAVGQNLDFETPEAGWTALTEGVTWDKGRALRGEQALRLESPAEAPAWAVSEPLEGFSPGKPVEVSLGLRRLSGEGEFAMSLLSEAAPPQPPALWRGVPRKDTRWHRLALRLVTGLDNPRIALGSLGAPAVWLVDDIRIGPTRVPPITRPVRRNMRPEYPDSLPAGWIPQGNMDLLTRSIMGVESVYIRPGALELNPQREITLKRGERVGMELDALSRGVPTKRLRIEVLGPVGWRTEQREIAISGKGSAPVNIPLQPLLAGDMNLRMRFTCDGDTKQMPLLIHSERYYPALGVLWRVSAQARSRSGERSYTLAGQSMWDADAAAEAGLDPFTRMPAQFHHLCLSPSHGIGPVARLAATGADVAVTWRASAAEARAALARVPDSLMPSLSAFGLESPGASITTRLRSLTADGARGGAEYEAFGLIESRSIRPDSAKSRSSTRRPFGPTRRGRPRTTAVSSSEVGPVVACVPMEGTSPAQLQEFCAAIRKASPEAVVMGQAFQLHATPAGLTGGPELTNALQTRLAHQADVLTVRLPQLPGSAVLREAIDGKAGGRPMLAWLHFDRSWDMSALRGRLRDSEAYLPFLAQGVGGLSTGDEALDALLLSRVILHVFAMGANGLSVPARASDPAHIAFLSPDGKPNEALLQVYGELTRELAGVRALAPLVDTEVAGYRPGKPVSFRPFLRGDEGIVALWNNTQAAVGVSVEVRIRPQQLRLLRISYPGELCQREYISEFEWDKTARHWRHPAVYLDLQPLQVVILSLKFTGVHEGWLSQVGPKAPPPPESDPMGMKEFDERVWGPK